MTPDRQHPDDSEYLHAKPNPDPDESDLADGDELADDAEPMAPPTPFDLSMPSSADESETTTSGRSRRASVRRSSQSHRLMRTVLERLRDYDIDEVRVLRNKALASSKTGESARRAAAAVQKPADPSKPTDPSA